MGYINKVQQALKEVYSSKIFFFISLGVAFAFFIFQILVTNYRILFFNFSFLFFFSLLKGTISTMTAFSFVLLIIISFFVGIVTAMTVFLVKRQLYGSLGSSSSGILVSLIVPSCPSCATGILGILGVGGFLTMLPFRGLELSFLGIGLLGASTIHLSSKITTKTCAVLHQKRLK